MTDNFFVIEPEDAERMDLGHTRWFGQRIHEGADGSRETLLTVDETLWQAARSISLLAGTLRDAGIDPTADIGAGFEAVSDEQIMRYVRRFGWPVDW